MVVNFEKKIERLFEDSQHWSDEKWKSKMAGGGGNKKKIQYCTPKLFKVTQDAIPLILRYKTMY